MTSQIQLKDDEEMISVCGSRDDNIDWIEERLPVTIIPRGNKLIIEGNPQDENRVVKFFKDYLEILRNGSNGTDIRDFLKAWEEDTKASSEMAEDTILTSRTGEPIGPRTVTQKEYVEAIREHEIVFGIGPAGTGKTYLAMAMALSYLHKERVSRIVLTRPAVEAGESLGFLPGDLQEKVNPYLRPLYDAIYDMMDFETCDQMLEEGIIEVAPLSFMRGRTFNDSFVILDEAQNVTAPQMKMFLTRFGQNSTAVINGDITQIDLQGRSDSGLVEATKILEDIDELAFIRFSKQDVVRHSLVQEIIEAYEDAAENR
ncbi:MAG: PhoH family protein [bacterium]